MARRLNSRGQLPFPAHRYHPGSHARVLVHRQPVVQTASPVRITGAIAVAAVSAATRSRSTAHAPACMMPLSVASRSADRRRFVLATPFERQVGGERVL